MNAAAIAIPIVAIVGGLTMIIFLRYFDNVERMAMISKGLNPFENQKRRRISPDNTLRIGLLLVGAGIGLFLASSLEQAWPGYGDGIHVSLVMIFGGAGLLTSYIIQMRNEKKSEE
jgi:hypothetical protein